MYARIMGKLNARRNNLLEEGEKGFTLIELLVVVIIIGILAAIAIPIYIGVQNNAKDSAVKSDLTNAKTAVVAYFTDKGAAPSGGLTLDKTTLSGYGFTQGTDTTTIAWSGTAPAKSGDTFCIVGTSDSTGTPTFNVTDATGVLKGSTCGVNTP